MNILGKRIKSLRKEHNLNQMEFAKILNISNSTLSQYETGQRVPSDDIKIKIANHFSVSSDYLLGITDDRDKHTSKSTYTVPEEFTTTEEAREYINKHQIFGSQGFDPDKLDDEEIIEFANELLEQMKMVSWKYRK